METKEHEISRRSYDTKKSIQRARKERSKNQESRITVSTGEYAWANKMDRVNLIRKGLPYEAIDVLSKRAALPVKQFLRLFGIPQTTYNKKKRDQELLSGRDSEMVLVLTELMDFGVSVFNDEVEKFQRWLKKPNISLGGVTPESLFDSITGIHEVSNSLNRLEYGNLA
ncbi:putative toxin-antitoxin system antitoxin component, TIGR02293 family [Cyclobacterium lianum]|uniref:Putative toxin-antitoxin system antitoxin component, TIGR02293 family n=1 Tax=Cyclobacterium lianum TaxID=388280 RepID=A0A1M7NYH3_9BACT|nr:antitoxin Xre/MbcA/ParS toxin-binding domain-containing protein [Cyclobacterium lianum]SHN09231.1 putative toxin-antitoxin system antitoxin component, TIGR02293 family [Cyclobacterium lianum]